MIALCGCSTAADAPRVAAAPVADACAPAGPISDAAQMQNVARAAPKLMAAGKAAPAAEFIKQLSRTQCTVTLPAPGKTALSGSEIYNRCGSGVLVLASLGRVGNRMSAGAASAFVISADGVFVTNYHVIDKAGCDAMVAMTREGKVYGVREILAADKAADCAIGRLDVGADRLTPLPLSPAAVGADVFVISHPDNHFYYMTRWIVARYAIGRAAGTMEITADYAHGSSGGAVLDATGTAVGMVASTHSVYYNKDNSPANSSLQMVVKQCVPASAILKLIKRE